MATFDLSLAGSATVTDSLAVELLSFSPRIEDAIAVVDELTAETDYHRELADAVAVVDALAVELSQLPGEVVRELADAVLVTDAIEVLLFDGNIHLVTGYTKRGRPGSVIEILGSGFAASNNNVRLDGTACTILTESTTRITVTQPTTFNVTDGFAILQVNNFDNNRFTEVPYWIKDAVADLETKTLPDQVPGAEEFAGSIHTGAGGSSAPTGVVVPDPTRAEARMWQRMATMVDFLLRDTLVANGDIYTRDAVGLTLLDGDAAGESKGQRLVADSTAAEGIRWGHEVDADFPFGVRIASGSTVSLMRANGLNGNGAIGDGDEWSAPLAGTIDAVYVYQRTGLFGHDNISLVRILVDGSQVFTSGAIGIGHRGRFFAGGLGIAITAGQRIQLEVTKNGTLQDMDLLGAVRMQTT